MRALRTLCGDAIARAGLQVEVQVADLALLPAGAVAKHALRDAGLVKRDGLVVVLGAGELSAAYSVQVDRVTAGARAVIEKAGGVLEDIRVGKRRYWMPTRP